MPGRDQYPVPQSHGFKRVIATLAMVAALAGCTTESKIGDAESTTLPSAVAIPQMAGLAAMNLVYVANPDGQHDQIFEQSLALPDEPPIALTGAGCDSKNPEVSPKDGNQLVYYSTCADGHNQILTLNLANHTEAQLTHDTQVQNYDPTYVIGADGKLKIVWKRSDPAGDYGELSIMDPDGSKQRNLTPGLIAAKKEAWKPTAVGPGQLIFGTRGHQSDANSDELNSLNLATGATRQLTTNDVPDWYAAKGPENTLVFVTKQDGHDVLATMGLDGKNRQVIVDMPGDSDDPWWKSDGSVILFVNSGAVYAYEVPTGRKSLLYDGNTRGNGRALSPILVPRATS